MGVREFLDVPRVYIDMDGPAAHFERAFLAAGVDPQTFKKERGVYRDLPVVEGLLGAIADFENRGLEVFFLTKIPVANPYAATEKLLWVQEVVPHLLDRVIISSDKGAVGTPRDFLVDDHPEWANANNFRGTLIRFEGDWAPVRQAIEAVLENRTEALMRTPQPVEAINTLLTQEGTGWCVAEAQSVAGAFLQLYSIKDRGWELVTALPRETTAGSILAMAGIARHHYLAGVDEGRRMPEQSA